MKRKFIIGIILVSLMFSCFTFYPAADKISAEPERPHPEFSSDGMLPDEIHGTQMVTQTQTGVVMHDFYGTLEFTTRSIYSGEYECDITCEFTYTAAEYTHMYWRILDYNSDVLGVWLDDKPIKAKIEHDEDDGIIWISTEIDDSFEYGEHSMRFKYNGSFEQSNPDNSRYQCFVNGYHAHMYEGWWPVHFALQYTDIIHTSFDLKMPNTWYMMGDFIPEEYRDDPSPTGEYHMEQYESYPPIMRICCGEYEVTKYEGDNYDIRMYAFRGQSGDAPYLIGTSRKAIEFFSEYYEHPCETDFFLAAQTGRRGNGKGMEGGFIMDTTYLNRENMAEDFISHEVSHVCWWGGRGVMGNVEQPHLRFLNEATAEFSCLLFCEQVLSEEMGFELWKDRMKDYREEKEYFKSRGWTEPPIIDPYSARSFVITYFKGACIFWALRYYMGTENFRNAMIEIFDTYAREHAPSDDEWYRPSIADFYQMFKKHANRDISGFWSAYITGTELPRLEYSVNRIRYKGEFYDSVKLKNPTEQECPLMVHVYKSDGTFEEVILEEKEQSFRIDGHASGIYFHDYMGTMPGPDDLANKMNTASIAAVVAWKTPTIYVSEGDGQEYINRANKWSELTGGEVKVDSFKELPFRKPIILVGPTATLELASEQYKNLRIKESEEGLNWLGKEFEGDFSSIVVTYKREDIERPIIIDTGTGDIPDDLAYTGLFSTTDGKVKMGYNYLDPVTEKIPSPDELCQLPWEKADSTCKKSFYYLSFTNKRPFKIKYNGFSKEDFEYKDIEKTFDKETLKTELLLDLSGGKTQNIKISHTDRFVTEEWDLSVSLDPKVKEFAGPKSIQIPDTVKGNSIEVNWINHLEYIYALDDQLMTDWKMGSRLNLSDLEKGRHTLKLLFNKNGLVSPVIKKEFVSGVTEPELQFDKPNFLWKNGEIKITGTTTPDATLDPPGIIDEDGKFLITITNDEAPTLVKVTAKNEYGLETSKTVNITKFIGLNMYLGKENVTSDTGETWTLDVPPQLINGSTYVPMRFIGERLGADVSWVADEKKVVYSLGNTRIEIWIGKDMSRVNGLDTQMPGKPVIVSGRTLVPVRFVSEALGAKVIWYGEDKKIVIEYPNIEE